MTLDALLAETFEPLVEQGVLAVFAAGAIRAEPEATSGACARLVARLADAENAG